MRLGPGQEYAAGRSVHQRADVRSADPFIFLSRIFLSLFCIPSFLLHLPPGFSGYYTMKPTVVNSLYHVFSFIARNSLRRNALRTPRIRPRMGARFFARRRAAAVNRCRQTTWEFPAAAAPRG